MQGFEAGPFLFIMIQSEPSGKGMRPLPYSGAGTAGRPGATPRRHYSLSTRFSDLPGSFPVQAWGAGEPCDFVLRPGGRGERHGPFQPSSVPDGIHPSDREGLPCHRQRSALRARIPPGCQDHGGHAELQASWAGGAHS